MKANDLIQKLRFSGKNLISKYKIGKINTYGFVIDVNNSRPPPKRWIFHLQT